MIISMGKGALAAVLRLSVTALLLATLPALAGETITGLDCEPCSD